MTAPAPAVQAETTEVPEPDGGFVAWFDPNGDPYAVFHRNPADDDEYEGWIGADGAHWFNADQHDTTNPDPMTWDALLAEMAGFDGPHRLVRA